MSVDCFEFFFKLVFLAAINGEWQSLFPGKFTKGCRARAPKRVPTGFAGGPLRFQSKNFLCPTGSAARPKTGTDSAGLIFSLKIRLLLFVCSCFPYFLRFAFFLTSISVVA